MTQKNKLLISIFFLIINILLTEIPMSAGGNILIYPMMGFIFAKVFLFPLVIIAISSIWKEYRTKNVILEIFFNTTVFIFIVKIIGLISSSK